MRRRVATASRVRSHSVKAISLSVPRILKISSSDRALGFDSMETDAVFRALADASRRDLLDRLFARNGQTLTELCDGLAMTRQAVSKHLGILEEANLVTAVKRGREKLHYLNPVPIAEIADRWIGKFERVQVVDLVAFKTQLERPEGETE